MTETVSNTISLSKFTESKPFTKEQLLENNFASEEMLDILAVFAKANLNVLTVGNIGSGKTTFNQFYLGLLDRDSKIVTLEKTLELNLKHHYPEKMVVSKEYRASDDFESVLEEVIGLHPTTIAIGEIHNSATARAYLSLTQTGHSTISTITGYSLYDAVYHLLNLNLDSYLEDRKIDEVGKRIAYHTNIVVSTGRLPNGTRVITKITELVTYTDDKFEFNTLFELTPNIEETTPQNPVYSFNQVGYLSESLTQKIKNRGIPLKSFKSLIKEG